MAYSSSENPRRRRKTTQWPQRAASRLESDAHLVARAPDGGARVFFLSGGLDKLEVIRNLGGIVHVEARTTARDIQDDARDRRACRTDHDRCDPYAPPPVVPPVGLFLIGHIHHRCKKHQAVYRCWRAKPNRQKFLVRLCACSLVRLRWSAVGSPFTVIPDIPGARARAKSCRKPFRSQCSKADALTGAHIANSADLSERRRAVHRCAEPASPVLAGVGSWLSELH